MSTLARNILYNLAGRVVLMGLGLLAVRFVLRRLGADAFGVILFTQTMGTVLSAVLDLGVSSTIVREVAAHAEEHPGYVRQLMRTAASLYWAAYVLIALITVALAPLLVAKWVVLQTMDSASATGLLQILATGSLLALPRLLYASVLRGVQRMGWTNAIDVSTAALQQAGTIIILLLGGDAFAVAWWLAVTYLAGLVAYVTASTRWVSWIGLLPGFSASAVRRNLRFSFHMMSITTLTTVHSQADKLALSKLLPIRTLGFYGFAWSVVSGASVVAYAIVQAALPSFSDLFHRGDRAGLMRTYRRLQSVATYATAPLFAAVAFCALPLFTFVFGQEVAQALLVPVVLLSLGFYLNNTLSVPGIVSFAVGRPGIVARQNFLALFIVLPVTVALVVAFGLVGAGLSWVFYQLFAYSYTAPRISRQCLDMAPSAWYAQVGRALALIAGTYGVAGALLAVTGKPSVPLLLAGYGLASVAFAAGTYLLNRRELRDEWRSLAVLRRAEAA